MAAKRDRLRILSHQRGKQNMCIPSKEMAPTSSTRSACSSNRHSEGHSALEAACGHRIDLSRKKAVHVLSNPAAATPKSTAVLAPTTLVAPLAPTARLASASVLNPQLDEVLQSVHRDASPQSLVTAIRHVVQDEFELARHLSSWLFVGDVRQRSLRQ